MDEKVDVSWTYCGHHFPIYVNPAVMLYAFKLYEGCMAIFPNETGKK